MSSLGANRRNSVGGRAHWRACLSDSSMGSTTPGIALPSETRCARWRPARRALVAYFAEWHRRRQAMARTIPQIPSSRFGVRPCATHETRTVVAKIPRSKAASPDVRTWQYAVRLFLRKFRKPGASTPVFSPFRSGPATCARQSPFLRLPLMRLAA
jgi:hypothetical protein